MAIIFKNRTDGHAYTGYLPVEVFEKDTADFYLCNPDYLANRKGSFHVQW